MSKYTTAAREMSKLLELCWADAQDLIIARAFENPDLFVRFITGKKDEDWQRLLRAGQTIHALKEYRSLYGTSLPEAKNAIETWGLEVGLYHRDDDGYLVKGPSHG